MASWQSKHEARKGLEAVFSQAYQAGGWDRIECFSRIALTGVRFRLWSPWGACKLMILGCALGRSVKLS